MLGHEVILDSRSMLVLCVSSPYFFCFSLTSSLTEWLHPLVVLLWLSLTWPLILALHLTLTQGKEVRWMTRSSGRSSQSSTTWLQSTETSLLRWQTHRFKMCSQDVIWNTTILFSWQSYKKEVVKEEEQPLDLESFSESHLASACRKGDLMEDLFGRSDSSVPVFSVISMAMSQSKHI